MSLAQLSQKFEDGHERGKMIIFCAILSSGDNNIYDPGEDSHYECNHPQAPVQN